MKYCIIGSGISGLSTCYYLNKYDKDSDITLYEKNNKLGGHSYTYNINKENKVDLGFQVFNKYTYPNLLKLFDELDVEIDKSDMSFSYYSNIFSWGCRTFFAILLNLFNFNFIRMLIDVWYFNYDSHKFLKEKNNELSLLEFCKMKNILIFLLIVI